VGKAVEEGSRGARAVDTAAIGPSNSQIVGPGRELTTRAELVPPRSMEEWPELGRLSGWLVDTFPETAPDKQSGRCSDRSCRPNVLF
jgi:hypothetical protein